MAIPKSKGDSQSHPKAQSDLCTVLIQLAYNKFGYTQSNLFSDNTEVIIKKDILKIQG